ncbi:MAG: GTP-binding protein [Aliiglaciecola sp.]
MVKHVPTNIITGALGVGKTTVIRSLLKNKPKNERWAVLVNEFGEVGIDGAFLSGETSEDGIFIKEVPGGCMCCTSGLPMQIAMNLLLSKAKPQRLLIEPTGLGHPKEVLQTLTQEHYKDVLNVQGTLTLIDVRKLENEKWKNHLTFREQMQIADTVVVTKSDLYTSDYKPALRAYMDELDIASTPVVESNRGSIDDNLLAQPSKFDINENEAHHHTRTKSPPSELVAPENGAIRVNNSGEGYYSRGWLCAANQIFDYRICQQVFQAINVERLKAVVITDKGLVEFNVVDGTYEESQLSSAEDSRIEIISRNKLTADTFAQKIENELGLRVVVSE